MPRSSRRSIATASSCRTRRRTWTTSGMSKQVHPRALLFLSSLHCRHFLVRRLLELFCAPQLLLRVYVHHTLASAAALLPPSSQAALCGPPPCILFPPLLRRIASLSPSPARL